MAGTLVGRLIEGDSVAAAIGAVAATVGLFVPSPVGKMVGVPDSSFSPAGLSPPPLPVDTDGEIVIVSVVVPLPF